MPQGPDGSESPPSLRRADGLPSCPPAQTPTARLETGHAPGGRGDGPGDRPPDGCTHARTHPGLRRPKLGVSGGTPQGAGDTPPRRAWVLMPLRRPARRARPSGPGPVPGARPAPSPHPVRRSSRSAWRPRQTGRHGFSEPARPPGPRRVRGWAALEFLRRNRCGPGTHGVERLRQVEDGIPPHPL